ncbi:hypothetical protein PSECIP111854_00859 [Pseudoalteromonas sp. CIP111854]|uniref:DUF349 domain-containing protein n=1 Tax=Pseudoalteromonas holothuriae TaxID=2963714 RepID=A0A9W4QT22_9GAMM|nr:DUF349 domain-containing protein [Pseudoalteromonas sp. CIP111854]CAH9051902.1 hypothetical protein PSECIP111854_00859 [Pseudoalteromonas sp. CIP111854]
MIFKHLFTPKWKHPKTAVRLAAVDKLDTGKDAEVLQTLALKDSSAEIRKKALHKVNNLVLWWQAYKQDQSLKELAEQQISSAVLNKNEALSDDIRCEYIDKYASAKLLEKLAFSEKEIQIKVKLLKRLANAKLIERAFKDGEEELQVALLPLIEQYQLDKTVLKSAHNAAKTHITNRIEQQRLAKEMPTQVEQQTKVVLAKLNALREKTQYLQVEEQSTALLKQWQEIELKWLNEDTIATVDEKFNRINEKLTQHLAKLKHDFDTQQAYEQALQAKASFISQMIEAVARAEKQLAAAIEALEEQQTSALADMLSDLRAQITQSEFSDSKELLTLSKQVDSLTEQLAKLPELIAANTLMQKNLDELEQVTPAQDITQLDAVLMAQKAAYEQCKTTLRKLPTSLHKQASARLNALSKQFKQDVSPLVDEQQNQLKQARRKAKDVQRLIDQGRFNVAFGVFNGFLEHYEKLTEYNQQSIEKLHSSLNDALKEVRDWQKYAATPKRAELLLLLDEKLIQTDIDPKERAKEVKLLRARWNELGRIDTDEEKAQATLFDEKIELLFAPCREFFAQQERQRDEAKKSRTLIIEQMQELGLQDTQQQVFDWRQYESQFNRIAKQWRSAGSVDGAVYKTLNNEYRSNYNVVNDRLKAYHQSNAVLKQQLVEQAQQQLELDDLASACEQLKELQKQWQTIGFAGSKQEHTLWQNFRAHNDAVFVKRSEQFELQKQQQSEQETQQQAQLDALASQLHNDLSEQELEQLTAKVSELRLLPSMKKLQAALVDKTAQLKQKLAVKKDQQKYDVLIAAIEHGAPLPEAWQQAKSTSKLTGEQLLLRLEILAEVSSPAELKSRRMAEQVALLDAKLQGEKVSFKQCLLDYFSVCNGQVDSNRVIAILKR